MSCSRSAIVAKHVMLRSYGSDATKPRFTLPPVESVDYSKVRGIVKEVITEGTGSLGEPGQTAIVHYVGSFINGAVFDSSRKRGTPFEFKLGAGEVIKGWDMGIATMREGETAKFLIAADHAYGAKGLGAVVPPDSVVLFEVEVLKFK